MLMGDWEKMQDTLKKQAEADGVSLAGHDRTLRFSRVLQAGIDKLSSYYLKMEHSDAYAISMGTC